jgi:hypothetical protein
MLPVSYALIAQMVQTTRLRMRYLRSRVFYAWGPAYVVRGTKQRPRLWPVSAPGDRRRGHDPHRGQA